MSEKWQNVGRIKGEDGKDGTNGIDGERGPEGPKGERGNDGKDGVNGKDGKDGNPLIIMGSYENESELPESAEVGNAYIVDGDLYVWGDF